MSGMKSSTIRLVLKKKLESWVASINDPAVAELCRKHSIVSGGAITSMLLGEPINDYDIYFRNEETAEAVAKHYVAQFNRLNGELPKAGVSRSCNPEVRREEIVNCKGVTERRIVIRLQSSGVAAEGQTAYQYFEGAGEQATEEFAASVTEAMNNEFSSDPIGATEEVITRLGKGASKEAYRPVFLSDNAITLSEKMQIVIRFFGEPDQIHENYDYAHCMCYYDIGSGELSLPPEALECVLSKTLIYKGSLYPLASVFRIRKFIERGWRITAGQLLKILFQVSELNLKDMRTLREQLIGVDQAYMHQLIAMLSKPEAKIDSAYIAKLIDGIFE